MTFLAVCAGCAFEKSTATQPRSAPPASGPPPVQYPPPAASQPPVTPAPPAGAPPSAPTWTGPDPIQALDFQWLRNRATTVLGDLIATLRADDQGRVRGIPLVFDPTVGEVNAFAACIDGRSLMAITDGMLEIAGYLAQAKADDDLYGTRKVDDYIAFLAKNYRPKSPIPRPAAGFFDPVAAAAANRIQREHDVFDELVAFILGHELAHHYLGHLPCTGGGGVLGAGELARAISSQVPIFNQPNELAADAAGTNNVLMAGARRSGYRWTEAGGLLTMRFFSGVDQMSPIDLLFAFERTHPPPGLRVPVIQQTANAWRITGGWLPIPRLG